MKKNILFFTMLSICGMQAFASETVNSQQLIINGKATQVLAAINGGTATASMDLLRTALESYKQPKAGMYIFKDGLKRLINKLAEGYSIENDADEAIYTLAKALHDARHRCAGIDHIVKIVVTKKEANAFAAAEQKAARLKLEDDRRTQVIERNAKRESAATRRTQRLDGVRQKQLLAAQRRQVIRQQAVARKAARLEAARQERNAVFRLTKEFFMTKEKQQAEAERLEAERLRVARVAAEQAEAERVEAERVEAERALSVKMKARLSRARRLNSGRRKKQTLKMRERNAVLRLTKEFFMTKERQQAAKRKAARSAKNQLIFGGVTTAGVIALVYTFVKNPELAKRCFSYLPAPVQRLFVYLYVLAKSRVTKS